MIISEQLIKSFVEDYTLRELQQISSIILHNFDARIILLNNLKQIITVISFIKMLFFGI